MNRSLEQVFHFNKGKIYRHRNFLDVDIYILNSIPSTDEVELEVYYVLQHNRMLLTNKIDKIKVLIKDFDNWKEIR